MFFSGLLNNIKEKHIKPYMKYLLQTVNTVMNQNSQLDRGKQEQLLKELKAEIPVVVHNSPAKLYEVEKKIDQMLKQGKPFKVIHKEIAKLRKYSFQSYIQKNLQALQTNPKEYHRCVQSILGWNLTLGAGTAINENIDLDPQQAYEDEQGEVYYGEEAKEQV